MPKEKITLAKCINHEMYKLKRHGETVMIGLQKDCLTFAVNALGGETTIQELLDDGWKIEPVNRTPLNVAFAALTGLGE